MAKSHARWMRERDLGGTFAIDANTAEAARIHPPVTFNNPASDVPQFRSSDRMHVGKPARLQPKRKRRRASVTTWTTEVTPYLANREPLAHFQPAMSDEHCVLHNYLPEKSRDVWERDKGGKRKANQWRKTADKTGTWLDKD